MISVASPRVEGITVEDVMTRELITAPPSATTDKIAMLMREFNIGSVIIVDDKGNPIGIVTERDLVIHVLANNLNPSTVLVQNIMSSPVISVDIKTSLIDAVKLMAKRKIRRLIVMDKGKLVGIITSRDILSVAPEVIEILLETVKISEGELSYGEVFAGYCDDCGEWSDLLKEVNGKFLCPDCRSNYVY